jgi:hypothetical protein
VSRVGCLRHTDLSRSQNTFVVEEAALELGNNGACNRRMKRGFLLYLGVQLVSRAWFDACRNSFEHGAVDIRVEFLVQGRHFGDALPLKNLQKCV